VNIRRSRSNRTGPGLASLWRSLAYASLIAAGCGVLAVPERSYSKETNIIAAVAESGSEVDTALQNSLNLPARGGLPPDQVIPWVRADRDRLTAVLHAFGYFKGHVDVLVDGRPLPSEGAIPPQDTQRPSADDQVHISFVPVPGPLYRIGSVRVVHTRNSESPSLPGDEVGLGRRFLGERAAADVLARMEAEWLWRQREAGHAFAAVAARTVALDAVSDSVAVILTVDDGPQVKLGTLRFQGLWRNDPESLNRYIPFMVGDSYQPELLDRLRAALQRLPYVRSVRLELAAASDASGLFPVTVTIAEKPPEARRLALSGLIGAVTLSLTATMLAVSQLARAMAFPFWQRHAVRIDVGVWVLLIASALLALQRFLDLAAV